MPAVAFRAAAGVEEEEGLMRLAGRSDLTRGGFGEANFYWIEDVVAAVESNRSFVRRIEQIAQCGDGAVVQIRGAQPDAVERRGNVTVGVELGHGRALDAHLFHFSICFFSGDFCPGFRALGVRADFGQRDHFVGALAARFVAGGAIAQVDLFPGFGARRIDRVRVVKRPGGWGKIAEVTIDIGHAAEEPRARGRAEAERGVDQNGAHGGRVAGPVEQHLFARVIFSAADSEIPDGRKIGRAHRAVLFHSRHEIFGQVHGVVAARTPIRFGGAVVDELLHPGELLLLLKQRFARERDEQVAVNLAVDEGEAAVAVVVRVDEPDLVHDRVGIETRIVRRLEEEAQHRLHVKGVRGRGDDDAWRFIFTQPIRGGVADGAVVRDAREPDRFLREADGHLRAFLPDHAKGTVAARPRHEIGEDARQDEPEVIRNAAIAFRA